MCVPLWKLVSFGTFSWQTPGQGTAWQTGAGSHPPAGAGLGCHHLYGDITSTTSNMLWCL